MGKHDKPSAGKTPDGGKGAKPTRQQAKVQREGGGWDWVATVLTFGKGKKKK